MAATLSLRMATKGPRRWYVAVVAGYLIAFTMLGLALAQGMPLGVGYGIWAAAGVAITALASRFLFQERFSWVLALGIALIVGGVLLIELGSAAH